MDSFHLESAEKTPSTPVISAPDIRISPKYEDLASAVLVAGRYGTDYYHKFRDEADVYRQRSVANSPEGTFVSHFDYEHKHLPNIARQLREHPEQEAEIAQNMRNQGYEMGYRVVKGINGIYFFLQAQKGRFPYIQESLNVLDTARGNYQQRLTHLLQYALLDYFRVDTANVFALEKHLRQQAEACGRQLDISRDFQDDLGKEHLLFDAGTRTLGAAADLGTNEASTPQFFQSAQQRNMPNGYLVGIGAGAIFSLLDIFPENTPPKAVLAVDISPGVITLGKMLFLAVKDFPDYGSFEKGFLGNFAVFGRYYFRMLALQPRPIQQFLGNEFPSLVSAFAQIQNDLPRFSDGGDHLDGNKPFNVFFFLSKHYRLIQKLAFEENIDIMPVDITNRGFWDKIKSLPGFSESKNVLYFSNAIDHIANRDKESGLKCYGNAVEPLTSCSDNILSVDTLRSRGYVLRLTQGLPHYTRSEIKGLGDYPV